MLEKKCMKFFKYFLHLKIQTLDPDPDPRPFSKPWIRIRKKWMQIRNPAYGIPPLFKKSPSHFVGPANGLLHPRFCVRERRVRSHSRDSAEPGTPLDTAF